MPAVWKSISEDILHVAVENLEYKITKRARSIYPYELNRPGNVIFLVIFAIILGFDLVSAFHSKQIYYSVCFTLGFALEVIGYLGRVLAFHKKSNLNLFIMQIFGLNLAPAFIMAGIYFMFAQIVMIHGRQYSLLKPMMYSYIFISSDVLSILVQGGAGGILSSNDSRGSKLSLGNTVMFGGILIQIIGMTAFLVFWFLFLGRTYFNDRSQVQESSQYKKKSMSNYFKMLFNVLSAKVYKEVSLEPFYNPDFRHIREQPLFSYYPLAISVAVILVYIRCIYRVVELKMGSEGYLKQHEIYLFVLDSAFIAVTGLIFVPFHPMFVFGRNNVLTSRDIRKYQKETNDAHVSVHSLEGREKDRSDAVKKSEYSEHRSSL